MKLKYINHGIGFRINNTIYLNNALKNHSKLYQAILNHEIEHTSDYTKKDFLIDWDNKHLKGLKWPYYKFILTHPRALSMFIPILRFDGKTTVDINMLMVWLIVITIILWFWWLI